MLHKAVLDRIVDDTHAVLLIGDDEIERIIPASQLPTGTSPGSWLSVEIEDDNRISSIVVDSEETERAQARIADKMDRLRKRGRKLED